MLKLLKIISASSFFFLDVIGLLGSLRELKKNEKERLHGGYGRRRNFFVNGQRGDRRRDDCRHFV